MTRPIPILSILLVVLALAAPGCVTDDGAAPTAMPERADLPLRIAWIQSMVVRGFEDVFRPMQYAAPTVADDLVFVGDADRRFCAFRAANGALAWEFRTYGPIESAPVVAGDLVILGDGDGHVYALDRKTGVARWTYRVQGQVMGRLAVRDNLVYVRTNHERLYALTVDRGKWVWMQSRELPVDFTIRGVASPVIDGDRVLVGYADGYLLAYDAADGTERFKTLLEKGERFVDVDATPIVQGDRIYIASYGGTFYCLARETADIQWTFSHGSVERAAIVEDTVYLGDDQGFIHALDAATGQAKWSFDIREHDAIRSVAKGPRRRLKVPTNPLPYGNLILVASSSGYLYALDRQTGTPRWQYWPGYGVTSELVVADEAVYVFSNFGNLYCLKKNYAN